MHTTAYLGLGSNLGNRVTNIHSAIDLLRNTSRIKVVKTSAIYETPAFGGPSFQLDYLNTVVKIDTSIPPFELLSYLKKIERRFKRKKTMRWAPRIIDLDILLYSDLVLLHHELSLPHPLMHKRIFVLRPMCDITASLPHPLFGVSMKGLLKKIRRQKIEQYLN